MWGKKLGHLYIYSVHYGIIIVLFSFDDFCIYQVEDRYSKYMYCTSTLSSLYIFDNAMCIKLSFLFQLTCTSFIFNYMYTLEFFSFSGLQGPGHFYVFEGC
jgi:hypothetical protein